MRRTSRGLILGTSLGAEENRCQVRVELSKECWEQQRKESQDHSIPSRQSYVK
jgi:hypothetical protein